VSAIRSISARQILDSRGEPTIEVDVTLTDGTSGRASAPSGASKGEFEAVELRDGEPAFSGRGVRRAIEAVEREIAPALVGEEVWAQETIDGRLCELDGTANKSRLGANAIVATSVAVARAAAANAGMPLYRWLARDEQEFTLPVPFLNVINGGAHARNSLDFQEFLIAPAGAETFAEAMRLASEVFHELKRLLAERGLATSVGDEGGFAPDLAATQAALETITEAIERAGHTGKVVLALDPAASGFHAEGGYMLVGEETVLDAGAMIDLYEQLLDGFSILSLEDGLAEDDWQGWRSLTSRLGGRVQLVGDDIFVTNEDRLARGVEERVANAILIKLNQIGTLTETLETIALAKRHNYGTMISHRSGETEDTTIADLAVATKAAQIKAGAPSRGERIVKYNRLLRIEEELGDNARYAGWAPFERATRQR
jgi:enolase